MPNEKMMRVFHVDDGENVNSYTVRDSHINLGYVTCSTAASTTAKEASFSEDIGWRLRAGSNIIVKFTYDVPANATLNVASTGAKAVYHKGTNVTSGVIKAGDVVTFIYDGTNYVITSIDRIMSGVFGEMSANDVISALGYTPLNPAIKGASNGLAELDNNGKVPASQLPSYVDDVLEYNSLSAFPSTGEDNKIYVAKDTNKIYRWSGSGYVEISSSLALGETASTAYRGDLGKAAYDHASAKGTAYASGMYKITTNGEGHVTAATPIAQSDITGLGIKPTQTAVSDPSADGTGVEFIDTISQDTDGVVTATKKTVRTFGGATSSVDGSTGLVAAPSAGEEDKVLTGAGTWQYMSAASKTFELETVRNVSGSYTHNTSFADVTADMKPISLELSNPEVFLDVINVYCHDGYITLSCDSVIGTSTVKVTVLKQARGQNAEITSAEFDAIAARIGLENAGEDVSLTIPANGWSNSSPYTYTWESDKITTQCRVIVDFSNGTAVIDVPYVTYEKVDGGVQFTAPAQPTTDIPVKIHIIQDYATRVIDIDDETVSSNVVPGTSNVKEALIVLKNNLSNVTPMNVGTQGQILRSDGNGGCKWGNAATQQEIGSAVTTWLNNNIDPTETAVIDNTLSVAHAAAEAKTTGDEITHLKSALDSNIISEKNTRSVFDYAVPDKNLFNPYHPDNRDGCYYNSLGQVVTAGASGYGISHFIEIEPSTAYVISGTGLSTAIYNKFYNENFEYIDGSITSNRSFTSPATARYIEFCYTVADKYTKCQLEKGSSATAFEPYQRKYAKDMYDELKSDIHDNKDELSSVACKNASSKAVFERKASNGSVKLSATVTGSALKVYCCKKNFIDVTDLNKIARKEAEWTIDATNRTVSSTNGYYRYCFFKTPYLKAGEAYTFSCKTTSLVGRLRLKIFDSTLNTEYGSCDVIGDGYASLSFVPEADGYYAMGFYGAANPTSVTVSEIQGERNSAKSIYEAYTENVVELAVGTHTGEYALSSYDGECCVFNLANVDMDVAIPLNIKACSTDTTILTVGTGKQYQTIKAAIDACICPAPDNKYIIEFYGDGTEYDLSTDTTAWNNEHPAIIDGSNITGIIIPDYTTLKGIGGKDKCILALRLNSESNYISPINVRITSGLEGLTIIGYNTRYVVHDDFRTVGAELGYERHIKDCRFVGEKTVYSAAWGAGFYSGIVERFENCIFENQTSDSTGMSFHNNVHFKNNAKLYFVNCRIITDGESGCGFNSINTNADGVINEVYIYGCKLKKMSLGEISGYGKGILFRVSGYCNDIGNSDVIINNTDGVDYSDRIDLVGKYSD